MALHRLHGSPAAAVAGLSIRARGDGSEPQHHDNNQLGIFIDAEYKDIYRSLPIVKLWILRLRSWR